ncbi:MAG TPA: DsbA family protein [Gammaproteobacteria bacterium]|nr:DsbA family protein [Gammaproteobacteria bacterium]
MKAIWYFDFISPYAYLQAEQLGALPAAIELELKPVLFAALLDHWGQLGPAEIPPKRTFTYRHVQWLAGRAGVTLNVPRGHPFNPLRLLRLAVVLEGSVPAVQHIFRFVWRDGRLPDDDAFDALAARLGVSRERIEAADVKAALRRNGEEAIAAGVFGVPTFVADGYLMWGLNAGDMLIDYERDPGLFSTGAMRRIASLPELARRR